ncbi:hypothetical protein LAN31_22090, partial [Mycobacterium tuberculosis]|nr:hypothetical protein [Mycobacterium tuberculosis]
YYIPGFERVKPHGNIGDRGNDGWVCGVGVYYQVYAPEDLGNDSNLMIVFYVQIMPDDLVMQLHRF